MSKRISKRMKDILTQFPSSTVPVSLDDSLGLIESYAKYTKIKFVESVDVSFAMGIDLKKSDQTVKGFCDLPHGNGKKEIILVFVDDKAKAKAAIDAGATYAGGEELIDDVKNGKVSGFTKCIAMQDMMKKLVPIARILGPQGLMPNIKLGTVVTDVVSGVESLMKGKVGFSTDKFGFIKLSVGRVNFSKEQIKENILALYHAIKSLKPASVKADYFNSLNISTTMGCGVKVKMSDLFNI